MNLDDPQLALITNKLQFKNYSNFIIQLSISPQSHRGHKEETIFSGTQLQSGHDSESYPDYATHKGK